MRLVFTSLMYAWTARHCGPVNATFVFGQNLLGVHRQSQLHVAASLKAVQQQCAFDIIIYLPGSVHANVMQH